LHTKVFPGIPDDVRWVLSLYARKVSKVLGRRVTEDDYRKRGTMQLISAEQHELYWVKKSANKATDFYGKNANIIKALRKTVTWTDQ
jgi:hypothetical protein